MFASLDTIKNHDLTPILIARLADRNAPVSFFPIIKINLNGPKWLRKNMGVHGKVLIDIFLYFRSTNRLYAPKFQIPDSHRPCLQLKSAAHFLREKKTRRNFLNI